MPRVARRWARRQGRDRQRPPGPRDRLRIARAAELSHSEWRSLAHNAAGIAPVTPSRAPRDGFCSQSASRQPVPRTQVPLRGCRATRASASASELESSSRTSRRASAQLGKCTWESVKAGSTQRPRRSTRSGLGSAASCVPTPPATSGPAIESAPQVGRDGSIVRTTPLWRIIAESLGPGVWRPHERGIPCDAGARSPPSAERNRCPSSSRSAPRSCAPTAAVAGTAGDGAGARSGGRRPFVGRKAR